MESQKAKKLAMAAAIDRDAGLTAKDARPAICKVEAGSSISKFAFSPSTKQTYKLCGLITSTSPQYVTVYVSDFVEARSAISYRSQAVPQPVLRTD